ncbi:xanthine dehydrogenase family protein molybdopterin-binding subunit [Komagataeibacter rhaeticus]|uniref:xanthine dehydrogenase family protein molybdopterin-binding subunit n=1 Tax=Komagataeibacter rhaeticus TaxID=215221 RepID=UPI0039E798DF
MIGQSIQKWDALDKARGAFPYPSDLYRDHCVHLRVLRAGRAHARIVSINTDAARQAPGVVRILTHADIPGLNSFGLIAPDQPVLCHDRVRFCGDAVALVVAESEQEARHACKLIHVEYEDLAALLDARQALAPDAPQIGPNGNLCHEVDLGFGDVDAALEASDHIVRLTYITGRQEHAFLEPEAGIAWRDEKQRIAITCGGQNPFADQKQIAAILGVPLEQVHVSHPPMGGAFGGKEDLNVQAHLALAVHATGRPARYVYEREESIGCSVKRHRFEVDVAVGCDATGRLTGFKAILLADTGAYMTLGPAVLVLAAEHASGPYRFQASRIQGKAVHTNTGNASAFRGFGNPQVILGIEQAMDALAAKCGMNPVDFRGQNLLRSGDQAGAGHIVRNDVTLPRLIAAARKGPLLRAPEAETLRPDEDGKLRATGFAFVWQGFGLGAGAEPGSSVTLRRDADGQFWLDCSSADLGEGNLSAFQQIAASKLGCAAHDIGLDIGSTDNTNSWSTNASRSVVVTGNAVAKAARQLAVRIDAGENGALEETAHFAPDFPEKLTLGAPHIGYSYGIQAVRIALDVATATVAVEEVETWLDAGTVINPDGVTGQIEGGLAQGLGFALSEDLKQHEGRVLNNRFSSYILPTIRDVPVDVRVHLINHPDASNPLGARGIAEVGLTPAAPAIANALARCLGHRFEQFPITPEAILPVMEKALS